MLTRDWWLLRKPAWFRRPEWLEVPEWWSRPAWLRSPSWLREPPDVLGLALGGILLIVAGVLYLTLPPAALPAALPGGAPAEAAAPQKSVQASAPGKPSAAKIPDWYYDQTAEEKEQFWQYVNTFTRARDARLRLGLPEPLVPKPIPLPSRYWTHATFALLAGVGAIGLSWRLSGTRVMRLGAG